MTGDRARLSLKLSDESWVNLITAGPQKLEQGYLVNCHSRQAVTNAQIVVNGILNTEHSKVVTLPHRGPINHTHTSTQSSGKFTSQFSSTATCIQMAAV